MSSLRHCDESVSVAMINILDHRIEDSLSLNIRGDRGGSDLLERLFVPRHHLQEHHTQDQVRSRLGEVREERKSCLRTSVTYFDSLIRGRDSKSTIR